MSSEPKSHLFETMDVRRTQVPRPIWKRYTVWGGAAVLALGGLIVWAWSLSGAGVAEVARSDLYFGTVKHGTFEVEVQASGELLPAQSELIAAPAAGVVERVLAAPGQYVVRGEALLELSDPHVVNAAQNAAAELAAARADLIAKQQSQDRAVLTQRVAIENMQVSVKMAAMHLKADAKLVGQGIVPRYTYVDERLRYGLLQQQLRLQEQLLARLQSGNRALLEAERARVHQQAALAVLREAERRQLTVRAPVAGQVEEINAEVGQDVAVGANLARVITPKMLMARLQVSQYDAGSITPGLPVRIDTHDGVVTGRVVRVDPRVEHGLVSVDVRLTARVPAGSRVHQSVDATIRVTQMRDVDYVARPADVNSDSTADVFVLTPGGDRAVRRAVHFGVGSVNRIQVLSGLRPGERVVLSDTSSYASDHALELR
jgi:multidrug efflux pump subunit AcrA (membrane-fusion protein)